jgi:hypothetical protein
MNKEAYDESYIDPVDRCVGNDHRGLAPTDVLLWQQNGNLGFL